MKNARWWTNEQAMCRSKVSLTFTTDVVSPTVQGTVLKLATISNSQHILLCLHWTWPPPPSHHPPFNFLYVTHFLRGGLGHLQCTDTITLVHHRWGSVSTAPLRVRGVFCSDSWSWSRAFTLTMAGSTRMRKSLKWGRDLLPVCDGELAWFQHFNTPKDRKTD